MFDLLPCKTKIVATIGPASESPEMMERLIRAGMSIARLNFSHGDFSGHGERIKKLRAAAEAVGRPIVIMADLPGPKMRIGSIAPDPVNLKAGDPFVLTTEDVAGTPQRVSVSFKRLPVVVQKGRRLFLNDGLVQLMVEGVDGKDVFCRVEVGGELRSKKGLNLPGIDLGISAFTDHDRACLEFAIKNGVDAVSQSFVEKAADLEAVRTAAGKLGGNPFLIAKIERADALEHYDEILSAADGVMVARGDLGVEVPLEGMALTQKNLIARANRAGKPVITATQMLESMTASRLPTRAEATDVANAVLDGTDAVMLSAESAVGKFPEEAVATLARIAAATEKGRPRVRMDGAPIPGAKNAGADALARVVEFSLTMAAFSAVLVPTRTGTTARMISRFKPTEWVVAVSRNPAVSQGLQFSYGVLPRPLEKEPDSWDSFIKESLKGHCPSPGLALLVAGPSAAHPNAHHRVEFIPL
ncbi:MAG: pyruvate kinase [Elusimicrobia bacterium]|nr:pyruvate kinase [Elusimicrobiota bacterium]